MAIIDEAQLRLLLTSAHEGSAAKIQVQPKEPTVTMLKIGGAASVETISNKKLRIGASYAEALS
jgi:hypothetical protein